MILKLKVKTGKKKQIIVWILNVNGIKEDVEGVLKFFQDNVTIKKRTRIYKGYRVSSNNLAIMLTLHSSIQDLISEIL